MQILFSAGEASGDLYAASIARELLRIDPTVRIGGIGGTRFAQIANQPIIADSSTWGAMSVIQSLRKGFGIIPHYRALKRAQDDGLIRISRGKLEVLDTDGLARHAH